MHAYVYIVGKYILKVQKNDMELLWNYIRNDYSTQQYNYLKYWKKSLEILGTSTNFQTWGQVHEYLYLSTLKYKFESTCTLLKYFLNFPNVLVLILKYYTKYLYVLEYLRTFKYL